MSAADTAVDAEKKALGRPAWASLTEAVPRYLIQSVPVVTAQTLAVCRIVFGLSVLYFWLTNKPQMLGSLGRSGAQFHLSKFIDQTGFLTFLSTSPQIRLFLYWTIISLLVAFVIGLLTRFLYPVLVVMMWLAAFLENHGHFITPMLLAMTSTVIAPWSDRWSADSLLSRRGPQNEAATPYYGYAIWLLGLSIGLTYTAAGLSKIILTHGGWLWETGARNGLIQDVWVAVTDWGTFIANYYWPSLGASVLSGVGQTIYVWASFTRSPTVKYAIGLFVALPFLVGLMLFMGLFWWPWAVLVVILYLPWPTIDRLITRGRAAVAPFGGTPQIDRQRTWFLSVTTLMIAVHAYAVITRTEYEPVYSNYPMYADRMLGGSKSEKEFWERFKTYDRNFRFNIQIVGQNGQTETSIVQDITNRFYLYWFLGRYSLWRSNILHFSPQYIFEIINKNEPLRSGMCETLKTLASEYGPSGAQAKTIRYGKRYFDLVDGKIIWLPVKTWTEVDLTAPGCPYRQVTDNASAGTAGK